MINFDEVPFVPSPNFYKGRTKPVQLIIIHTMEAQEKNDTAENVAKNWFAKSSSKVSAHYCVDNNTAVQCVFDSNTAWHCKNGNSNGIGIELAGKAAQSKEDWNDVYSVAELDIAAQLGAYLCKKFNIPVRRARFRSSADATVIETGFCGHVDVPGRGSHTDPGTNFPWAEFLSKVEYYRGLL
jgi:N-acetyl-anhydromuramyl-L-alanine amidase AmpD